MAEDVWDEILHEAKLDGVPFPLTRRHVEGTHAYASHKPAFRDGQDVERLGRDPYTFDLTSPFFDGLFDPREDGLPWYPDGYDELRLVLEAGGVVEYIDPILGPIDVQIVGWGDDHEAARRNGAMLTIKLEEVTRVPQLVRVLPQEPRGEADNFASLIDQLLIDNGIDDDDLVDQFALAGVPLVGDDALSLLGTGAMIVGLVDQIFAAIDEAALAVDEVAALVDEFRSRLDAILSFDALAEVSTWSLTTSIARLGDSVTRAADKAVAGKVPVIDVTLSDTMSAWEIALDLYADPSRAGEIIARNPTRYPLAYPRGTTLRVLAE